MAAPSHAPRQWQEEIEDLTRAWTPRTGMPHPSGALPHVPPPDPPAPAAPAAPTRRTLLLRGLLATTLCLTLLATGVQAVEWARVRLDDLRYGRPRTTQISAFVGHHEAEGVPTQLLAVNLNRRVTLIEIPGSDPARIRTIAGPYLVGRDEDLTVATMRLLDVNGDTHLDLLLRVKNEELVYINDRGEFRLMTRDERPQVERALGGAK